MLRSIQINNFRNFKLLSIDPLARINLIVGKNNAGKTNLLDAVSLYASGASLNWVAQILERRELLQKNSLRNHDYLLTADGENVYASLFPHWNDSDAKSNRISISAKNGSSESDEFQMRLVRLVDQHVATNGDSGVKVLDENESSELPVFRGFQTCSSSQKTKMMPFRGEKSIFIPPEKNDFIPFRYVSTEQKRLLQSDEQELWGRISILPIRKHIVESLKIVDARIADFGYIPSKNIPTLMLPYVRFAGSEASVPLRSLGEGIQKILSVMLNLVNVKNGILLIDEFENGLHYSIQDSLWKVIFELAKTLDVQCFITTHSEDCVRTFTNILHEQADTEVGQMISLLKVGEELKCSIYKAKHLKQAFEKEMEVR